MKPELSVKKGINPRFPVLKQALLYDEAMGPLVNHIKVNNINEIDDLKNCLTRVAQHTFDYVRSQIKNVPKTAPLEIKQRHNDTISWLRTRHNKTLRKIKNSTFGK